jgi:SsrA-binding protein
MPARPPKPDKSAPSAPEIHSIARNKRARHDYHLLETFEAGLVLVGTEVKSLRDGRANISDAYGILREGEPFLINLHISPYERGGYTNHEPERTRKLLLHRKEIRRLIGAIEREGLTLVPLELYFKNGVAKVALALAKGKKLHDKRDTERTRDAEREMARVARSR